MNTGRSAYSAGMERKELSASVRPNSHKIAVRVYPIPDTHNRGNAIFERVIVAGTVLLTTDAMNYSSFVAIWFYNVSVKVFY